MIGVDALFPLFPDDPDDDRMVLVATPDMELPSVVALISHRRRDWPRHRVERYLRLHHDRAVRVTGGDRVSHLPARAGDRVIPAVPCDDPDGAPPPRTLVVADKRADGTWTFS